VVAAAAAVSAIGTERESGRERRRERKKGGEAGKGNRKPLYIFGGLAPK